MGNHLTPLEVVERLIGKPEIIGAIVATHPKSPYQWHYGAGRRAAGDIPYAAHMRALLSHSAARGLGLTAEHLIWGAPASEVEGILATRQPHPDTSRLEAAE